MPTVVKISRNSEPISGDFDLTGTVQAYEDVGYQVEFSDGSARSYDAITAKKSATEKIPDFGDTYGNYVLVKKTPKQRKNPFEWDVICHYRVPEPAQQPTPESPTTGSRWGISIRGSNQPRQEELQSYLRFDEHIGQIVRQAMVSTMGDPITGIMKTKSDAELVVSFTCLEIPWDVIEACLHLTNYSPVTLTINGKSRVYAANTMLLDRYEWEVTLGTDGDQYPRVTLRLLIRKGDARPGGGGFVGWNQLVPNRSRYYRNDAGEKTPFCSGDGFDRDGNFVAAGGVPSSEPWFIDADSKPVGPGMQLHMIEVPAEATDLFQALFLGVHT